MSNAVLIVVALVIIVGIIVLKLAPRLRSLKANLTQGTVEAEASEPRGASIKGAVSHQGSVVARDRTGQGASIEQAEAKNDIIAETGPERPKV